jgi:hypothetical protein
LNGKFLVLTTFSDKNILENTKPSRTVCCSIYHKTIEVLEKEDTKEESRKKIDKFSSEFKLLRPNLQNHLSVG